MITQSVTDAGQRQARPLYGSRCLGCEGCTCTCFAILELLALPRTRSVLKPRSARL